MEKVDITVQLVATNHDDEEMSVEDWKEAVQSIFDVAAGDIDLDVDIIRIEVSR